MSKIQEIPLMARLKDDGLVLTPKGRLIADFVLQRPREAVFLRTRGLAEACGVSEATVVRFVGQLGYEGYGEFIQALRDLVDTELTLVDRVELTNMNGQDDERLGRVIFQEIDNLKRLYEHLDIEAIDRVVDRLSNASFVYVIGSRLSYTFAYYMGWSLSKIRSRVQIFRGSDSTTIDQLTTAPEQSLVVVIATSRYPNELIRVCKLVRRLGHELILLAESPLCPMIQFANIHLIAPCKHFPIIGSPSTLACLINCLTMEMMSRNGDNMRSHQEKLEQAYREHDILFNLEKGV